MDLSKLTSAQRAELKAQLLEEEKAAAERARKAREDYRDLVDAFVRTTVKKCENLSSMIQDLKREVFSDAEALIESKNELFKVKMGRWSDTFTTADRSMSVSLGDRTNERWDDTVTAGIEKIREYLKEQFGDGEKAPSAEMIMALLAKDSKGNLKVSRILELEQLAIKWQAPKLIEGIGIIKQSYRPSASCKFIQVKVKDETGKERCVPLSMSGVD